MAERPVARRYESHPVPVLEAFGHLGRLCVRAVSPRGNLQGLRPCNPLLRSTLAASGGKSIRALSGAACLSTFGHVKRFAGRAVSPKGGISGTSSLKPSSATTSAASEGKSVRALWAGWRLSTFGHARRFAGRAAPKGAFSRTTSLQPSSVIHTGGGRWQVDTRLIGCGVFEHVRTRRTLRR
jgi:hypothetical protein